MTNQQHPITLSLEMVEQWVDMLSSRSDHAVFSLAAQWGADQELEACCDQIRCWGFEGTDNLRAARRPKPPSLKEQALESLHHLEAGCEPNIDLLRRALEALPDD
jgi:hypothetical protein